MAKWLRDALEISGYIVVVLAFVGCVSWMVGAATGMW